MCKRHPTVTKRQEWQISWHVYKSSYTFCSPRTSILYIKATVLSNCISCMYIVSFILFTYLIQCADKFIFIYIWRHTPVSALLTDLFSKDLFSSSPAEGVGPKGHVQFYYTTMFAIKDWSRTEHLTQCQPMSLLVHQQALSKSALDRGIETLSSW